jgi:hypothetical protein
VSARPVVLPGGDVVVPAALCPRLAEALRLYADECRGVRRPAAAPRPRMTPGLEAVDEAVRAAAQAFAVRRPVVAASEVTVAQAAVLLSLTPQRVRQLLYSGDLVGRQVDGSRIWLVDQKSIDDRRAHGGPTAHAGVRVRGSSIRGR